MESALDALRAVFVGASSNDVNRTASNDKEALFTNLYALTGSQTYRDLRGQVRLVASGNALVAPALADSSVGQAHRFALLELLPFAVVANTEALNQALYGYYAQRLSLYDEQSGQGELTRQWISDRAAMVG